MDKLIVTADIHGSLSSWLTIKSLLRQGDSLAIAGDLFDTKYGSISNPDFQPETIKSDLKAFKHPLYYVYGNCDTPDFCTGFDTTMEFCVLNKKLFLTHGHRRCSYSAGIDIIIQGHTHQSSLEKKGAYIFMNPGSITHPRNGTYTYGVITSTSASLIELKTGNHIVTLDF